jgi:hypothetical protein
VLSPRRESGDCAVASRLLLLLNILSSMVGGKRISGGWFREGSWCGGGTHKHRAIIIIIKMERLGVLGSGDVELSILFIGDGECLCARWQPRAFLARRT